MRGSLPQVQAIRRIVSRELAPLCARPEFQRAISDPLRCYLRTHADDCNTPGTSTWFILAFLKYCEEVDVVLGGDDLRGLAAARASKNVQLARNTIQTIANRHKERLPRDFPLVSGFAVSTLRQYAKASGNRKPLALSTCLQLAKWLFWYARMCGVEVEAFEAPAVVALYSAWQILIRYYALMDSEGLRNVAALAALVHNERERHHILELAAELLYRQEKLADAVAADKNELMRVMREFAVGYAQQVLPYRETAQDIIIAIGTCNERLPTSWCFWSVICSELAAMYDDRMFPEEW